MQQPQVKDWRELLLTQGCTNCTYAHLDRWTLPDGMTHTQIDHICIYGRWMSSSRDVRPYRGADVASDHHLIVAKIKIELKKLPGKKRREVINTDRLKETQIRQKNAVELSNRFAILENLERTQAIQGNQEDEDRSSTIDTKWQSWRNIIVETGETILGFKRVNRKEEWISMETWKAINERKLLKSKMDQRRIGWISQQKKQESTWKRTRRCREDRNKYIGPTGKTKAAKGGSGGKRRLQIPYCEGTGG